MSDGSWPFADLKRHHYGGILADPPWQWKAWGSQENAITHAARFYDLMETKDIMALPVADLAARDAVLFIWVTWPMLPQAMTVIDAWGFVYKTCGFCWLKADNTQPDFFSEELPTQIGNGYWTRANSEVCLLATRGSPKRLHSDVRQVIVEPRRAHSRKPDCVYERIERLVSGPYCELFARTQREGWDSFGNEISKFGVVA